jgi:prepilin-type N-terminal cleavage/methylation domain-containing protein
MDLNRRNHAGFTWIELVMVLAVVGVLALMAIPVMSEGALRKQVKEGLELATVAKNGVQAFLTASPANSRPTTRRLDCRTRTRSSAPW